MVARETPKLRIRASTVKAFGQEFSVAGGCGQGSELVAVQLARLRDKPIGEMLAGDIGHAGAVGDTFRKRRPNHDDGTRRRHRASATRGQRPADGCRGPRHGLLLTPIG